MKIGNSIVFNKELSNHFGIHPLFDLEIEWLLVKIAAISGRPKVV